jgi:hypothetical protein
MSIYTISFKEESDRQRIKSFLEYVKSLDFVNAIELVKEKTFTEIPKIEPITEGYLPIDKIKALYPDEWILLAYPHYENATIVGGTVLLHEPNKREMALKAKDLIKNYTEITHIFTGNIPHRATIGLMKKITL